MRGPTWSLVSRERLQLSSRACTASASAYLLLVEDDDTHRISLIELLAADDVDHGLQHRAEAAGASDVSFEVWCDLARRMYPVDLADVIARDQSLLAGLWWLYRRTHPQGGNAKRRVAQSVIVGTRSPERLVDETALFLHRPLHRLTDLAPHAAGQPRR